MINMTKEEARDRVRKIFDVEPDLKAARNDDPDHNVEEPYTIAISAPGNLRGLRAYDSLNLYGIGSSWDCAFEDLMSCLRRLVEEEKIESTKARVELDVHNRRIEWLTGIQNKLGMVVEID